jgi:hypothetical protein
MLQTQSPAWNSVARRLTEVNLPTTKLEGSARLIAAMQQYSALRLKTLEGALGVGGAWLLPDRVRARSREPRC